MNIKENCTALDMILLMTIDENPPLYAESFAPAGPGEALRLRQALRRNVSAHDSGASLDAAIAEARDPLDRPS